MQKKIVSNYFDKIINLEKQTKQFLTSSFATLDALETVLATTENAVVLLLSLSSYQVFCLFFKPSSNKFTFVQASRY